MKTLAITLTLATLPLLPACTTAPILPSPQAIAAQSHLDQIKSTATEAKNQLAEAQGLLDHNQIQTAQAQVTAAAASVQKIPPLVDQTKTEAQTLSDQRDQLATQWNQHKDDLSNYKKAHDDDWLGPRAHRWILWICVVAGLLGTGYVFLMAAGEMEGGALAGAINLIGHLFTFGLKFIGTFLGRATAWLLTKFSALAGGAVTMLEKAAPNQPTTPKPAPVPT